MRVTLQPLTRVERVGLACALLLAVVLVWPLRGHLVDDTFVHQQYARHLAKGQGPVFNLGERVYGGTSPLWVALIADGIALGMNGLAVARVLGLLSTLAAVGLFMQLMRRTVRTPGLRACGTIAFAGHAGMLQWSMAGMETPLAVALVLGGFVAFTEVQEWGSRPVRTGALWALAALTRPEVVFLLMMWSVLLIIDTNDRNGIRRLILGTVPAFAIYGAWLLFARLYFGTFWPLTLSARSLEGAGWNLFGVRLGEQLHIALQTDLVTMVLLAVSLALGGRYLMPERMSAQRLLPWLWIAGLPVLYVARGVRVEPRYLLLVLPVLQWLTWRAAEAWWVKRDTSPARATRATLIGAFAAGLVLVQNFATYRSTVIPAVARSARAVQEGLVPWGKWFALHAPAGSIIATPDVGAIAFHSGRRVLDTAGHVSPRMLRLLEHAPQSAVVANFGFAAFARPEYLVDRAARPFDLLQRSPYRASLVPLGHATIPSSSGGNAADSVCTFYRIDWSTFDTTRAVR